MLCSTLSISLCNELEAQQFLQQVASIAHTDYSINAHHYYLQVTWQWTVPLISCWQTTTAPALRCSPTPFWLQHFQKWLLDHHPPLEVIDHQLEVKTNSYYKILFIPMVATCQCTKTVPRVGSEYLDRLCFFAASRAKSNRLLLWPTQGRLDARPRPSATATSSPSVQTSTTAAR